MALALVLLLLANRKQSVVAVVVVVGHMMFAADGRLVAVKRVR
jgi:hypothetical protein